MATKTVIELICDLCGADDIVETHSLTVDGHVINAEACKKCWDKIIEALLPIHKAGRAPEVKKVTRKKDITPFPGTAWEFTAHALKRMGERHISPLDAARAADEPTMTHPGITPDSEVRCLGNTKVVVQKNRIIVTASKRNEEVDAVA